MDDLKKQQLIDLLTAAKEHVEAGEQTEAVDKIESAIAEIENEGVEAADVEPSKPEGEGGEEGKPKYPPLPGQGTNGANP